MSFMCKSRAFHGQLSLKWFLNVGLASLFALIPSVSASNAQNFDSPGVSIAGQFATANLNDWQSTGHIHLNGDFVCGTDFDSDSARAANAAYQAAKQAGTLPKFAKTSTPHNIGDERTFNILDSFPGAAWEERIFVLIDKTSKYYLWVDASDVAHFSSIDVVQFRAAMMDSTPQGSINENAGIIVNNDSIFGDPPDYDQDGLTDILLYQIQGAGGFVTSVDIDPLAEPGNGNQADVLHMDPISNFDAERIAGHEYVHLLNLSTGFDETFLAEGYAEYGNTLNGYSFLRPIRYLNQLFNQPTNEGSIQIFEYELPMFSWRSPINGYDYQRANHFFTYVSEQASPEVVGQMLRLPTDKKGVVGLQEVMQTAGLDFFDTVLNFHAANYLNDTALGSQYGHLEPGRTNLKAELTREIDGENSVLNSEGEIVFETVVHQTDINAGAVEYIQWTGVADFSIVLDAVGFEGVCSTPGIPEAVCFGSQRALREPVRVVVYGIRPDQSVVITELSAAAESFSIPGKFEILTLIVAHTNPGVLVPTSYIQPRYRYSASWTPLSTVTDTDTFAELPEISSLAQNFPNPFVGRTTIPYSLLRSAHVKLSVFDLLGREKAALIDDFRPAGSYTVDLDALGWASGTYFLRMEIDGQLSTRVMHLVK